MQGSSGLEEHVNRLFDNAEYFTEQIRRRAGFRLVVEKPECTNITFWYVPPSLRGAEDQEDFNARLHKVPTSHHTRLEDLNSTISFAKDG